MVDQLMKAARPLKVLAMLLPHENGCNQVKVTRPLVLQVMLFPHGHRNSHVHVHTSSGNHIHRRQRPNSLLRAYVESKSARKALLLFKDLHKRQGNRSIDSFTLLFALKACTCATTTNTKAPLQFQGQHLHAFLITLGFDSVIFLQTALLCMYSAYGDLHSVHRVFDYMSTKNVVCWTSLISAYIDNGNPAKALDIFRQMQREKVEPDRVTLTTAICACADLGALAMGEWIHAYISREEKRGDTDMDLCLRNALINMYAKCGDIKASRRLFDDTSQRERDMTTWTSMIVGHALHGQADEALQLFKEMTCSREQGENTITPNEVTFIGVLMACSHAGWVEEGLQQLESMTRDYKLKPQAPHFGCVVDLLCRVGRLQEAYAFIMNKSVVPMAVVWRTLLGACSRHGDIELATQVRLRLSMLEPSYVGDSVALSNVYASAGLWDEKTGVREQIKQRRRAPGCSVIEVGSQVHEFVSADRNHLCTRDIYSLLESLARNYDSG